MVPVSVTIDGRSRMETCVVVPVSVTAAHSMAAHCPQKLTSLVLDVITMTEVSAASWSVSCFTNNHHFPFIRSGIYRQAPALRAVFTTGKLSGNSKMCGPPPPKEILADCCYGVILCQIHKWLPPHHLRIVPKKYMSKYLFKTPYPENLTLIA